MDPIRQGGILYRLGNREGETKRYVRDKTHEPRTVSLVPDSLQNMKRKSPKVKAFNSNYSVARESSRLL